KSETRSVRNIVGPGESYGFSSDFSIFSRPPWVRQGTFWSFSWEFEAYFTPRVVPLAGGAHRWLNAAHETTRARHHPLRCHRLHGRARRGIPGRPRPEGSPLRPRRQEPREAARGA